LFGIIALQMDFVTRDQLLAAMNSWVGDKSKSLGRILVDSGALSDQRQALLESLVWEHVQQHGDARHALASLGTQTTAREALGEIDDQDIQETLSRLEGIATTSPSQGETTIGLVGQATTAGGRFRLLRLHARGGLGDVFVARDEEVHREVALKQIRDEHSDNAQGRARFLLEAEITGNLEHPGIVPVYGLGYHDDGRPFYAMRFIRGESLKEAIGRFHRSREKKIDPSWRSLELRKLLDRFLDVCDAISYAHSRGVLHRDSKPLNVMLGPFGETLVVDWGLAKVIGRNGDSAVPGETTLSPESALGLHSTLIGQQVGTPAYMSPEAARGQVDELSPRSDVYSLGATLYAILTGGSPFSENNLAALLQKVEKGEFTPPRKIHLWIDPALEAICLKAMALRPDDRYATVRALIEDLSRWMADEPVAAWKEPLRRRLARWARRHRPLAASAAVAAVFTVLAGAYGFYRAGLDHGQRLTAAEGRVSALVTAEIPAVPGILKQIEPDRALVRDLLHTIARGDGSGRGDRRRLPAALALLPEEPDQADFLAHRALNPEVGPDEVLVIREALAEHGDLSTLKPLVRQNLRNVSRELSDTQLRAAGVLARFDPTDPLWPALAAPMARKLVHENALRIGAWREVFQTLARHLNRPLLELYADEAQPGARDRAFTLLLGFADRTDNARRAEDLASLLEMADPDRMERLLDLLSEPIDRSKAAAVLAPGLEPIARFDTARAARQARIAIALLRMGQPDRLWPLFVQGDEPTLRTELIHKLVLHGVTPAEVVARLRSEQDPSARRALLHCLGEYPDERLDATERRMLIDLLVEQFRTDPDPGIHGAIYWLLRRCWNKAPLLDAANRELASAALPSRRNWYVNAQGHSLTIVRGPVTFLMGSVRDTDPNSQPEELQHHCRIPRSFAIGMRELSTGEYSRFLADRTVQGVDRTKAAAVAQAAPEQPAVMVDWYDPARFCNWLSARDGLPESEWCYPKDFGPGSVLPANFLERTGYRLATEAEWEYACRAGTVSAWSMGQSTTWLSRYAWLERKIESVVYPVARLKPNDLGLFDMMSNVYEWCLSPHRPYTLDPSGAPLVDTLAETGCGSNIHRVLRGGTVLFNTATMRSAYRSSGVIPMNRYNYIGFRIARTIPARHDE
jgi:formylglycine-generating enzyme required for sulfatase activity/tRNA A-37 threonylcarbamoyl transferase component Bud32